MIIPSPSLHTPLALSVSSSQMTHIVADLSAALASSVQDMHDVSEIECHARAPLDGAGGRGGDDR